MGKDKLGYRQGFTSATVMTAERIFMKKTEIFIRKIANNQFYECKDMAALEAVYDVYLDHSKVFRVSCTPEDLEELITGRLYTENRIGGPKDIKEITVREQEEAIYVKTVKKGGESQQQNHEQKKPYEGDPLTLFDAADKIFEKPGELFRETGCAHCCVLWKDGEILCSFEDIGRHNALDKAVGRALLQGISLDGSVIFTSGRVSSDYLTKVLRSGISTVVSRAAVTERAAELACRQNIVLYGFVRRGNGNCYSPKIIERGEST